MRKNCPLDWGNRLKLDPEGQKITKTICSKSERSEQFLKQNAFLTYSWRFFRTDKLEEFKFKLEKIIGVKKHVGKVRNWSVPTTELLENPLSESLRNCTTWNQLKVEID